MALIKTFSIDVASSTVTVKMGSDVEDWSFNVIAYRENLDEPVFIDKCKELATTDIDYFYNSDGLLVELPDKPSPKYSWDWISESWKDLRDIEQAKFERWREIKEQRDFLLTESLVTPHGIFDANTASQKAITDAVLMLQTMASLGTPITIDFTLADNSTVTLNTAQMVEVGLLLGQRTQSVFANGRVKREAIDAATTVEEVESIVW